MTKRSLEVGNEDVDPRAGADVVSEKSIDANGATDTVLGGDQMKEKEVDVPPNGGYGWVCVACVATINA